MGGKVNDCKGKVVKSKNRISLIGGIRIMAIDITLILILVAAVVTGLLAGVSLDKSIVQLPAVWSRMAWEVLFKLHKPLMS